MKNKKRFVSDKLKASFIISLFAVMLIGNALSVLKMSPLLPQDGVDMPKGNNVPLEDKNASTGLIEPLNATTTVKAVKLITEVPDVEIKIRQIAEELNFKWPEYLVRLAHCESRMKPLTVNTVGNKPNYSYDRGLFQFNSYWQKGVSDECAFDIDCSTRKTIEMINAGKQHLWACDKIILAKK